MAALTAGRAEAEITPPVGIPMEGYSSRDRPAATVVDPLLAQALVLRSGPQACALVCTDLLWVRDEIATPARRQAAALSGLPAENILICASHTHWGPMVGGSRYQPPHLLALVSPEYRQHLIATLAGLVAQASRAQVPVTVACGAGFADAISFNRRAVNNDGRTVMNYALPPAKALAAAQAGNRLAQAWRRQQPPGPRLSEPLPELDGQRVGPADAAVHVLRLDGVGGAPLASLVSFGCHGVCGGGDLYGFSADFVGHARQTFQALTAAPMHFAAAAAGDQVPRWRQGDARQRVGRSLAATAARVWLGVDERDATPRLRCARRQVKFPLNRGLPSLDQARSALAAHPDPHGPGATSARSMVGLAEEMRAHADGYPGEVWAMALGEFALVGLPGEILAEIGLRIRQQSPFRHTMVVSLANGAPGYMPTDQAFIEGGYEPGWTPVGPGTEPVLIDTALALLNELAR